MKTYITILLFGFFVINMYSQNKKSTKDQESLINDLLGVFNSESPPNNENNGSILEKKDVIKLESESVKPTKEIARTDNKKDAYISSDADENKIYRDHKGNEVTYSKDMWNRMLSHFNGDESATLNWLIVTYGRKSNVKEIHKINIQGQLEFLNNNKFKVTFGKNAFGVLEYSDSNGNNISYSKEFADEIFKDNGGNEINIFMWLVDRFQFIKAYKETYIFDESSFNLKYTNSHLSKAELFNYTDVIMYKDSRGTKMEFDKSTWQNMLNKIGSEKKIFLSLIGKYLFNYIPLP